MYLNFSPRQDARPKKFLNPLALHTLRAADRLSPSAFDNPSTYNPPRHSGGSNGQAQIVKAAI